MAATSPEITAGAVAGTAMAPPPGDADVPQPNNDGLDEREAAKQSLTPGAPEIERSDGSSKDTTAVSAEEIAESTGTLAQSAAKTGASSPIPSSAAATAPLPAEAAPDSPESSNGSAHDADSDSDDSKAAPAPLQPSDDGWTYQWDPSHQAYYFLNRLTGQATWENPRQTVAATTSTLTADKTPAPPPLPTAAGGYNPALHGDYDDWLAEQKKAGQLSPEVQESMGTGAPPTVDPAAAAALYASGAQFNRWTGQHQQPGNGAERHTDEAKSQRQMGAFFDVDAAANSHDGRSLKAERSGKRLTKGELKHFKEKRKARKEEKRRAWLRD